MKIKVPFKYKTFLIIHRLNSYMNTLTVNFISYVLIRTGTKSWLFSIKKIISQISNHMGSINITES